MCLIVYSYMLFVTILLVYEVDPLCFLVWALNANRWCVRVFMWTRIGRSCSLMRQGMTLGRLTTPKRGVFTSGHVPSRSETPLLRDVLHSGSSVEGFACQHHLRDSKQNLGFSLRSGGIHPWILLIQVKKLNQVRNLFRVSLWTVLQSESTWLSRRMMM